MSNFGPVKRYKTKERKKRANSLKPYSRDYSVIDGDLLVGPCVRNDPILISYNNCHLAEQAESFACQNYKAKLRELLQNNPELLSRSDCLYFACLDQNEEMVKMLIVEFGANANQPPRQPNRSSPLNAAISRGNIEICRLLITQPANPDHRADVKSRTVSPIENCLVFLKRYGMINPHYLSLLQLLLENGATLPSNSFAMKDECLSHIQGDEVSLNAIKELFVKPDQTIDQLNEELANLSLHTPALSGLSPLEVTDELIIAIAQLTITDHQKLNPSPKL